MTETVNVRVDTKVVEQMARESHAELYARMQEKFPGRADAYMVAVRAAELAILITGLADPAQQHRMIEDYNKMMSVTPARFRVVPLS